MAGYSGTPLVKKLGIKERYKIKVINPPDNYFDMLYELPDNVTVSEDDGDQLDFVHIFTNEIGEMEHLIKIYKSKIFKNGMIWVSWYKKASKLYTEITENDVRNTALSIGLVDVKVCAVDEKWSGLKLVIRLKDR